MPLTAIRRSGPIHGALLLGSLLVLLLSACSGNTNNAAKTATTPTMTATATATATPLATPAQQAPLPTIALPGLQIASPTAGAGSPPAAAAVIPNGGLQPLALQVGDLPAGFALTNSGPGGSALGPDVIASYQAEFQQRNVTSTESLKQTIVIIDLLGEYRSVAGAAAGVKALNVQTLNRLLGGANLTAQQAPIPAIGDDAAGYHFTGSFNGTAVGGYLIVFHQAQIAALVVTAAVQGAESLPQTITLAQKQDQRLAGGR